MKIKIGVGLLLGALLIFPLTILVMHILKTDTLSNIEMSLVFTLPSSILFVLCGAFLIRKGELELL